MADVKVGFVGDTSNIQMLYKVQIIINNFLITNRHSIVVNKIGAGNVGQHSVTDKIRYTQFQQRKGASLYPKQRDVAVAGTEERK